MKRVCLFFMWLAFAQIINGQAFEGFNSFLVERPYEVLNYENKLRFHWPIDPIRSKAIFDRMQLYDDLEDYKHVSNTKKSISFIINNIQEIAYETSKDEPIEIDIIFIDAITKMIIKKTNNPINYIYKDTTLLFTGLHKIRLYHQNENYPLIISFDNAEDLKILNEIDFDKLNTDLFNAGKKEKLKHNNLITKEIIFNYFDGQITYGGKFEKKIITRFALSSFASVAAGQKGVGYVSGFGLGFINFLERDDMRKEMISSLSLDFESMVFSKSLVTTIGLKSTSNYFGVGFGYFREDSQDNENLLGQGMYSDFSYKKDLLDFRLRLLTPLGKKNISSDLDILFTAGYRINIHKKK